MTQQAINNYNVLVNQPADRIVLWLSMVHPSIIQELSEMLHCSNCAADVARVLSSGTCPPRL